MKQRIITGLILGMIALVGIAISIESFKMIMYLLVAIACLEVYQLKENRYNILVPFFMFASIYAMTHFNIVIQMIILSVLFLIFSIIHLIDEKFTIKDAFLCFSLVFLISLTLNGGITLYQLSGPMAILWVFVANYACDTGAYFIGIRYGKRKLNERLSPKKTIEGSIGGWIVGFLSSIVFGLLFLETYYTFNFLIVVSLLIPITAQVGDLFFSSIKRHYQVKDFGGIFPGHGGVLDRIDSLIFSLFLVNLLLMIWSVL